MSSLIRLLALVLLAAVSLHAEEAPSPTPTPGATPAPAASPSPSPASTEAPAPAEPTPTPEASPAPEASPSPSPSPAEDIIPIEGQPAQTDADTGAPLDTQDLAPALPDAAYTDPNAIVPDEPPAPPSLPSAVENVQQRERQISIRYKEVRVEAEKDPKVVNMLEQADKAPSPEARRAAKREYYRLLFKKMVSIDKSLEARCATMEAAYLRRLAQERIEPTIPLNPPPTPEPLAN